MLYAVSTNKPNPDTYDFVVQANADGITTCLECSLDIFVYDSHIYLTHLSGNFYGEKLLDWEVNGVYHTGWTAGSAVNITLTPGVDSVIIKMDTDLMAGVFTNPGKVKGARE